MVFLRGAWEAMTNGAAQAIGHVPRMLCITKWPSNYVVAFIEVAQAVEVFLHLKGKSKPLNFTDEVSLRNSRLVSVKGS